MPKSRCLLPPCRSFLGRLPSDLSPPRSGGGSRTPHYPVYFLCFDRLVDAFVEKLDAKQRFESRSHLAN